MTTLEVSPLFRSNTVGFERLRNSWHTSMNLDSTGEPAYNILKRDDDEFRISLAVPGFSQEEISIETRDGSLWVKGQYGPDPNHNQYLFKGIALEGFQRTFQLPEHVKIRSARLEAGMLHIDLFRELPEALRPQRIEIQTDSAPPQVLENKSKAA